MTRHCKKDEVKRRHGKEETRHDMINVLHGNTRHDKATHCKQRQAQDQIRCNSRRHVMTGQAVTTHDRQGGNKPRDRDARQGTTTSVQSDTGQDKAQTTQAGTDMLRRGKRGHDRTRDMRTRQHSTRQCETGQSEAVDDTP